MKGKVKEITHNNEGTFLKIKVTGDFDIGDNIKPNQNVIITEDTTEKYDIDTSNPKKKQCPNCYGLGEIENKTGGAENLICSICKGTGEVSKNYIAKGD